MVLIVPIWRICDKPECKREVVSRRKKKKYRESKLNKDKHIKNGNLLHKDSRKSEYSKIPVDRPQLQNNLCLGFSSLSSFLITPVQRLPRYLLFLRELHRYTPPDHPDYANLNNSFLLLSEFFLFILLILLLIINY